MATLQETVQATIRAITSSVDTYEGDWHAYADHKSIASGSWGGRVLALAQVIDPMIGTVSAAHNHFLQTPTDITA